MRRDRWIRRPTGRVARARPRARRRPRSTGRRGAVEGGRGGRFDRAVAAFLDYFGNQPAAAAAPRRTGPAAQRRRPAAGGGTGGAGARTAEPGERRTPARARQRLARRARWKSTTSADEEPGCAMRSAAAGVAMQRQPGAVLPRSVAPLRRQPADDCRHRRLGARAVAGLAGAGGQRQNFAYNRLDPCPRQRPPVAGRAGLEDHGDRHAGVGPNGAPRCCGPRT